MSRNYEKSINFCPELNRAEKSPFNADNPLTYCLFPTLGSQFVHGSASSNLLYSTYNPSCQNFMAEYCSSKWDKFCDTFEIMNTDKSKPNNAARDPENFVYAQRFLKNNEPTLGEMMIRNAVSLQFIDYPFIHKRIEPFDSSISGSPFITIYDNQNIGPSFIKPIPDIDNNFYIHKMLDNQKTCLDVIARLYAGYINGEENTYNFRDSILEKFFEENHTLLNYFLGYPSNTMKNRKEKYTHHPKKFYLGIQIKDTHQKFSRNAKANVGTIPLYPCADVENTNIYFKELCKKDHIKMVTYMDHDDAKKIFENKQKVTVYDKNHIYKAVLPKDMPKKNTVIMFQDSDFKTIN